MAQERRLLGRAAGLTIEQVRFHAAAPEWSPVYRAPARRLVLPDQGRLQLRAAGTDLFVDALTAFRLEAGAAYQLRPEPGSGARRSVVLSGDAPSPGQAAQAWLLAPAELFRLRLAWRRMAQGEPAGDGAAPLLDAVPLPAQAAPQVARARRLLAREPQRTLGDAADAACSSPFHLARLFRRHTGLSLHAYRQRLRIALALARLEAGERDIAGLAHEMGFASQSHFGEVFRREVGVTPAAARAMLTF